MYNLIIDLEMCNVPRDYRRRSYKYANETIQIGAVLLDENFNPAIEFTEVDMISMLYYLGYLTISGEELGMPELTIPNKVMKEIYADYFMQIMNKEAEELGK